MMRNPLLNELLSLRQTADQFFRESPFGDAFDTLWSRAESSGRTVARPMPLDVYTTDDDVVIVAAVPGMRPDDLQLTVQKNTVTLSGTIRNVMDSEEGKKATWFIHELTSGSYQRSITLPFPVDADRADATFDHGVLRVVIPKAEASKPKQIAIHSKQDQAIEAGGTTQS